MTDQNDNEEQRSNGISTPEIVRETVNQEDTRVRMMKWGAIVTGVAFFLGVIANSGTVAGWFSSPAATAHDIARLEQLILERTAPVTSDTIESQRAELKAKAANRTAEFEGEAAKLLADGKLDQGFEALKANARQKAQDAAQEWRDIGALAYDRDQLTALEAYRQATKLDDSDFSAWLYLARLEIQLTGDVQAARIAAEAAERTADSEYSRALVLHDLGLLQLREDDFENAKVSFQEYLKQLRKFAETNPTDPSVQRDLSIALERIGEVEVQLDNVTAARKSFHESAEISRQLAEASPGDEQAQRDFGIALAKLGGVKFLEGDVAAAREMYTESLEISQRYAEANPESDRAQRDLAFYNMQLADVTGDIIYLRNALSILERLEAQGRLSPEHLSALDEFRKEVAAAEADIE